MNLQFEISEDEIAKLDKLMKEAGLDSHRDLFNNSLTLFQWAVQQIKEKKVVASVDEQAQKFTEVQMDSLNYVADYVKKMEEFKEQTNQSVSA